MKKLSRAQIFEDINKILRPNFIQNFHYPKIGAFVICIIAAYFLFSNPLVQSYVSRLHELGYVGVFIAGILFTFGFTSPFSAGFFIVLNPENILLAGVLGGFGALLGDLFIFNFVRMSFMEEFERLKHSKLSTKLNVFVEKAVGNKIKLYLMYAFAGFIIASPLPDEAGVTFLAGMTQISQKILVPISFICNTLGILVLLWI